MGLSNEFSCEAGSVSCCLNPHRFFSVSSLRLCFPALEPWIAQSVSLPSCSSQLIYMQLSHCPVLQPLPCCESSPSLLLVWMSVSSLTPWLSNFHTVQFSGSSGYFVFKFVVVLIWVVQGGRMYLPTPPSWPEILWIMLSVWYVRSHHQPWLLWLHCLEHQPVDQRVVGSVPSQGMYLGFNLVTGWGVYKRQPIDVSLSH